MAGERSWLFTKEQLKDTPSRRHGISEEEELLSRQKAANHIQAIGVKLGVNLLCNSTAVVYMHRFYMYQSLKPFNKYAIAAACLFLACKVEEQPKRLEYVIKISHQILHKTEEGLNPPPLDSKSQTFLEAVQELVVNENILLQVLGFNLTVEHANMCVVKSCQMLHAPKDLAESSYFLCTNCLHLTMMCLEYPPKTIAGVCIHLASKWSNWQLPCSSEGKEWFKYVDESLTPEKLQSIGQDFLDILERSEPKLMRQLIDKAKQSNMASSSPDSRASSPAPSSSSRSKAHTPGSRSHAPSAGSDISKSKTYQDHKEKMAAAAAYGLSSNRNNEIKGTADVKSSSRAAHRESPLVRGDLKKPHPTDHQSSSNKSITHQTNKPPDPYNQHRMLEKRHHQQHQYHHHSPLDASPHKRPRVGENGNGSSIPQRVLPPPLPHSQPPLPPPPPT